ncbi:MAG: hypothetical protein R3F50_18315 [Gammaproteobacteria bacterium]
MRYDEVAETQDGIDESTSGFIDIQFGLIAILILALSVTSRGLRDGSQQLERSQSGSNLFIEMFLSDEDEETSHRERLSCARGGEIHSAVRFGDIALCAEWDDGVAVLGPWEKSGELFESGRSELPPGRTGKEFTDMETAANLVEHLRGRTLDLFPCLAPLDRNMDFEDGALDAFKALMLRCQKTHFSVAARTLDLPWSDETGVASLRLPGLDLFMIEGHADGARPDQIGDPIAERNRKAAVAGARAQRVLYAMLNPGGAESIGSFLGAVNSILPEALPFHIDQLASALPGEDERSYQSGLLDLVPLSRRVYQECYIHARELEVDADVGDRRLPVWCAALLGVQNSKEIDAQGFVQIELSASSDLETESASQIRNLHVPRLFALSNYDRFSLRHGQLGVGDPRDRRVEFRFLTAAIPAEIHQLVRTRGNTDFYLLYTAAATMELHNCDMVRAQPGAADGTCVERLNRLVLGELTGRPE